MSRFVNISYLLLILVVLSSCTSGRWVVKDQKAVDQSDYEVLEQQHFLTFADTLTPQEPTIELNVLARITRSYQQKMLVQRNIQDYRLRPGFVVLGLAGAAAAFYAANSSRYDLGSTQSLTLNIVGALLGTSGFLNLKPSGEPRAVGEERYLNDTGTMVVTDTMDVRENVPLPISFEVKYRGQTLLADSVSTISGGTIQLPLASSFNDLALTEEDPGTFRLSVHFNDSTYQHTYPISSVLEPYAQIKTEYAELRSEPVLNPENVLADLARGSQVKIVSSVNDDWYKVQYGNFENFISKGEATLIWRSADINQNDQVVSVPRVPFGKIDIESNIPRLRPATPNARALIITNENYSASLPERRYSHRDGELMAAYLQKALGYAQENIHRLIDIANPEEVYSAIQQIKDASNDSTELFIYAGGFGELDNSEELFLKSVPLDGESGATDVPLRTFFSRLGGIPSKKTIVVADIDFSHSQPELRSENNGPSLIQSYANTLTKASNSVLIMGSLVGEPSRLYQSSQGEDKKHHIFPYLFARALQQRFTNLNRIYNFLEQDISYTSRRLHDRAQAPMIFGDQYYSFTN